MDWAALLALVAAIAALVALAVVLKRPAGDGASAMRDSLSAQLQAAQQGTQGQVELVANKVFRFTGSGWAEKYPGPNKPGNAAPRFYAFADFCESLRFA